MPELPAEPAVALAAPRLVEHQGHHRQEQQEEPHPGEPRKPGKQRPAPERDAERHEKREQHVGVGVIRHLDPPAVHGDLRPRRDGLEKSREDKTQLQKIDPSPPFDICQAENHKQRPEIAEDSNRRKTPPELEPEESRPVLDLREERPFPGLGGLAGGCCGRLPGAPHQPADAFQTQLRKCPGVLRAVERIKKPLRRAGVGPVHRRVGRGGERHVGVRQQTERHHDRQVGHEAPFELAPPDNRQHHQPEHHAVEKPDGGFQDQGLLRKNGEAQVGEQRREAARDQKVQEHSPPDQEDRDEGERGHREGEVVGAEGQREKKEGEKQPHQAIRPSQPGVERRKEDADQQAIERVVLDRGGLRPHRKAEGQKEAARHRNNRQKPAPAP